MGSSSSCVASVAVLIAFFLFNSSPAAAQSACVGSLAPCSTYLSNTARPGSECCDPLARVARTNVTCLCDLAQLAASSSINATRALELPVLCNIPGVNATTCGIAALAPGASTLPPPPQSGASAEPPSSARSSLIFSYVTTVGLVVASAGLLLLQ